MRNTLYFYTRGIIEKEKNNAEVNIIALVRNIQIFADRNGNNNQIYGDEHSEITLFTNKLDDMKKNGELTDDDFKTALGYCTDPMAEHWETSNDNNAKSVLETFASSMDYESKTTVLKQLLGEDKVANIYRSTSWGRPIIAELKDGTIVKYNEFREELSYINDKVEKYYYKLDTGEFIEEIKQK